MQAPDNSVLLIALQAAVPLHIVFMRDWTARERLDRARWAADEVAAHGDVLLFGGERGAAAGAFNALAKGLAVGAYQPGGIDFAGLHWCVDTHELCSCREAS